MLDHAGGYIETPLLAPLGSEEWAAKLPAAGSAEVGLRTAGRGGALLAGAARTRTTITTTTIMCILVVFQLAPKSLNGVKLACNGCSLTDGKKTQMVSDMEVACLDAERDAATSAVLRATGCDPCELWFWTTFGFVKSP